MAGYTKAEIISIHALLAESDLRPYLLGDHHHISIHALLAESDGESNCAYLPGCISIHALLAESDARAAGWSV